MNVNGEYSPNNKVNTLRQVYHGLNFVTMK